MPIRFNCTRCGQTLSVSARKAGHHAACPKCAAQLTIPVTKQPRTAEGQGSRSPEQPPTKVEENAGDPGHPPMSPRTTDRDQPPTQFTAHDSDEWVYADDPVNRPPRRRPARPDQVVVSRRLIYFQGLLLGAVALISFALGILVGARHRSPEASDDLASIVVTGSLSFRTSKGFELPDDGAVVIAFRADRSLGAANRLATAGLRPGDPQPKKDHPSLRKIHDVAGNYARAGPSGDFEVQLPSRGQYYFLFLSHNAERDPDEKPNRPQIARMGRYFQSVVELIGDYRYEWRELPISRNESIDVTFE